MNKIHFIDTNILMYSVGESHPVKKTCLKILQDISEEKITAVTDTEVFQEIAYRYWCQKKWKIAVQVLKDYKLLFFEILPIEKEQLQIYYDLLSEFPFLSPRDAIHVAVMKTHNIEQIVTTDQAFKKLKFLKVTGPG